jgi:pantoate--beta-alanine ligase
MGNLHAGHLALVREGSALADRVVVSIFVNPPQFGPSEDFERYPRTLSEDVRKLKTVATDLLFIPSVGAMYPEGPMLDCRVSVPALEDILCGEFRPGHFTGVATVVTKLFNLVRPDLALFGQKDYQQFLVIRRVVDELFLGALELRAVPTVREADGLAMSSRNSYLSTEERSLAPMLYRTLQLVAERIKSGCQDYPMLENEMLVTLRRAGWNPDYIAIRRARDLVFPDGHDCELIALGAAWLGQTRLIDNIFLEKQA